MQMANAENGALQTAIDNAAVGETIMLTENIVLTSRVTVANVVTLDLNGYSISGDIDDGYGAIYVGTKGVLTIKDSSSAKTGGITNNIGNAIGNYGSVDIYDGVFVGNYALYNFFYSNSVYGNSVVHGGVFKSADSNKPTVANCGNLTINGGNIDSIDSTNTLLMTGGDVGSLYIGVSDYNPQSESTTISGGHVSIFSVDENSANNVSVSGGMFSASIDTRYLANGVKLTYDAKTGTYNAAASQGLKVIATSSSKLKDLVIKNGQLIFMQDAGRIAFDFKNKRTFYNQIVELTEAERADMEAPLPGYYFTIDKVVLWNYSSVYGWRSITEEPQEIVFIGVEFPELGKDKTLYVNKTDGDEHISVWDDGSYKIVADKTHSISSEDVIAMFK